MWRCTIKNESISAMQRDRFQIFETDGNICQICVTSLTRRWANCRVLRQHESLMLDPRAVACRGISTQHRSA
jgi:hypothetical protein